MKVDKRQIWAIVLVVISFCWFMVKMGDMFIEKRDWVRTQAKVDYGTEYTRFSIHGTYIDINNIIHRDVYLEGFFINPFSSDYDEIKTSLVGTYVEIIYDPVTGENFSYYHMIIMTVVSALNLIIWSFYAIFCFKKPDRRYIREFICKYKLQILSVFLVIWSVSCCVNYWQKYIDVQEWVEIDAEIIDRGKNRGYVNVEFVNENNQSDYEDVQMFHLRVDGNPWNIGEKITILYNTDTGEAAKYSRVIFNTVFFTLCWLGSSWFCMWSFKRLKRKEIN